MSVALAFSACLAHADTLFQASGTFVDGSVLSGTLSIDTVEGSITAANLITTGPSAFTFTNIVNQSFTQTPGDYNVGVRNAAGTEDFNFDLPDPSMTALIGYTGGQICSRSVRCVHNSNLYNLTTNSGGPDLVSGTLMVPTPEPSSLLLLGTGLVGMVGALKRRYSI